MACSNDAGIWQCHGLAPTLQHGHPPQKRRRQTLQLPAEFALPFRGKYQRTRRAQIHPYPQQCIRVSLVFHYRNDDPASIQQNQQRWRREIWSSD